MAKHIKSDSNFSIDSLEQEFNDKTSVACESSNENVDTILVPFYDKDVIIKVPKETKRCHKEKSDKQNRKQNQDEKHANYLVNKDKSMSKRTSYLEIFRKQLVPRGNMKRCDKEIRSISPEIGDSVRDSFSEDINNPSNEFFNTECYNEIYYEQLLSKDFEQYLDYPIDSLQLPEEISNHIETITRKEITENDFKSVSEVSQRRRHMRRVTEQPIQNIKLGGLGPDIERIKPRLERARSLQRYSEKVRMENRLKIYKKTIEDINNEKTVREMSAKEKVSRKQVEDKNSKTNYKERDMSSYLVNKTTKDINLLKTKTYSSKSKSAGLQESRTRKDKERQLISSLNNKHDKKEKTTKKNHNFAINKETMDIICDDGGNKARFSAKNKAINTEIKQIKTEAPVEISVLVNIGGIRPSSALRTLEEKHKMYQEKIKAFTTNCNMFQ